SVQSIPQITLPAAMAIAVSPVISQMDSQRRDLTQARPVITQQAASPISWETRLSDMSNTATRAFRNVFPRKLYADWTLNIREVSFRASDRKETERYYRQFQLATDLLHQYIGQKNEQEISEMLARLSDRNVRPGDLTRRVHISHYDEGTQKRVFLVEFETRKGAPVELAVVTKKEKEDGVIARNEISDLKKVSSRDLGVTPRFGDEVFSADGAKMYIEEFVRGKTAKQLEQAGKLTLAHRKKVVSTAFAIGLALNGAVPRDFNNSNFIIRDRNQEVVMVDIGKNRFSIAPEEQLKTPHLRSKFFLLSGLMRAYGYQDLQRDQFIFEAIRETLGDRKAAKLFDEVSQYTQEKGVDGLTTELVKQGASVFKDISSIDGDRMGALRKATLNFSDSLADYLRKANLNRGPPEMTSSSPVRDFKDLARVELMKLPGKIMDNIGKAMAMIATPHGAGRIHYRLGDGELKTALTELNKTIQPLVQDSSRDLTPQEIKAFVAGLARINDYQKTVVEPDAQRGVRGEKTQRQTIGGIVESIREDVNNYLHKSGTLYHRVAQFEQVVVDKMSQVVHGKTSPKGIEVSRATWEYDADDQLVERKIVEISVQNIVEVDHADFAPARYQEVVKDLGYPGYYNMDRQTMVLFVDSYEGVSSPIMADQSQMRFDAMQMRDKINRQADGIREEARRRERNLPDYYQQREDDLRLPSIGAVVDNARKTNVGPVSKFFNGLQSSLKNLFGGEKTETAEEAVEQKPQGDSQEVPVREQAVPGSEILIPVVMPTTSVIIPIGTAAPIIAPVFAPQVMSPAFILGKLESPFFMNDKGEIISRHAIDHFIDKAMATEGDPESAIPGRSGRDQEHHQKAVPAGAAQGPVNVPRQGEPLPASGGSGRGIKVPVSIIQVQRDFNQDKAAMAASPIVMEDVQKDHDWKTEASSDLKDGSLTTGTSPTAMVAADPFRMGPGRANASRADVVSSTNVVNVVPSESLENSGSVKVSGVSQLDRLVSGIVTTASWFVSELLNLIDVFGVREAEAASITVVSVGAAMQQTAGSSPIAGGENAGKRSKSVNEAKYRANDTHVEKVVTDRMTVAAMLRLVDQAVRLILKLYGLLMAEATRLYGLAKHRARRAEAKSSVSQPVTLGEISSGIGYAGANAANSSKVVTGRRVVSIASGRVYGVYVKSTRVALESVSNLGVRLVGLMSVARIEGVDAGVESDVDDNTVENRSTVGNRSRVASGAVVSSEALSGVAQTPGSVRAAVTGGLSSVVGSTIASYLNHGVKVAVEYATSVLGRVLGVCQSSNARPVGNEVFGSEGVGSVTTGRDKDTAVREEDKQGATVLGVWKVGNNGPVGIEFLGSARERMNGGVRAVISLAKHITNRVPGMHLQTRIEFLDSATEAIEVGVKAVDTVVTELFAKMEILVDYLLRGSEFVSFAAASSPVSSSSNRRVAPISTSVRVAETLKAAYKAVSRYTYIFISHISSTGRALEVRTAVILALLAYSIEVNAPGAAAQTIEAVSSTRDLIGMMSAHMADIAGQVSSVIGSENQSISTELTTGGALWFASTLITPMFSSSILSKFLAQIALSEQHMTTESNINSSSSSITMDRYTNGTVSIIRGTGWKSNSATRFAKWLRKALTTAKSLITQPRALVYSIDGLGYSPIRHPDPALAGEGSRQSSTTFHKFLNYLHVILSPKGRRILDGLDPSASPQDDVMVQGIMKRSTRFFTLRVQNDNVKATQTGEAGNIYRGRYLPASPVSSSPVDSRIKKGITLSTVLMYEQVTEKDEEIFSEDISSSPVIATDIREGEKRGWISRAKISFRSILAWGSLVIGMISALIGEKTASHYRRTKLKDFGHKGQNSSNPVSKRREEGLSKDAVKATSREGLGVLRQAQPTQEKNTASSPLEEKRTLKDIVKKGLIRAGPASSPIEEDSHREKVTFKERVTSREMASLVSMGILIGLLTWMVGSFMPLAALPKVPVVFVIAIKVLGLVLLSFMGLSAVVVKRLIQGDVTSWKSQIAPAITEQLLDRDLSAQEIRELQLRLRKIGFNLFKHQQRTNKFKYTRELYNKYKMRSIPLVIVTGLFEAVILGFYWFFATGPAQQFGYQAVIRKDGWFEKLAGNTAQDYLSSEIRDIKEGRGLRNSRIFTNGVSQTIRKVLWETPTIKSIAHFVRSRVVLYIAGSILASGLGAAWLGKDLISWDVLEHILLFIGVPSVKALSIASFIGDGGLQLSFKLGNIFHTIVLALLMNFSPLVREVCKKDVQKKAKVALDDLSVIRGLREAKARAKKAKEEGKVDETSKGYLSAITRAFHKEAGKIFYTTSKNLRYVIEDEIGQLEGILEVTVPRGPPAAGLIARLKTVSFDYPKAVARTVYIISLGGPVNLIRAYLASRSNTKISEDIKFDLGIAGRFLLSVFSLWTVGAEIHAFTVLSEWVGGPVHVWTQALEGPHGILSLGHDIVGAVETKAGKAGATSDFVYRMAGGEGTLQQFQ
ncbi:MAG: hypothetical protein KAS92_02675, partial [Candidatus Omnitrophica bacterium]|nr:hypothetical protein [Candidatus Omnitrophota bacterium]